MIDIAKRPCGEYQTNCYLVDFKNYTFIIDPGKGAFDFVMQNAKNPTAILITHGHFDHIWDVKKLQNQLKIPVICHKDDVFMTANDIFNLGLATFSVDYLVGDDMSDYRGDLSGTTFLNEVGFDIVFHHYAGHTPGCCAIEIGNNFFTGDFIFYRSVGRVDFPYSSRDEMIKSLNRFSKLKTDMDIHPGHGIGTSIFEEQKNITYYLRMI